jgi:DNA replicative helicase MCM subunit Mcm2 (Cdc46/Mcm family)
MRDLINFDDHLASRFRENPSNCTKHFEEAIETIYKVDYYNPEDPDSDPDPKFQL